jgi:hypothetical protein
MQQDLKTIICDPKDLPDFAAMTPAQEADFWESHELTDDMYETGDEVTREIDALLGITDADKH